MHVGTVGVVVAVRVLDAAAARARSDRVVRSVLVEEVIVVIRDVRKPLAKSQVAGGLDQPMPGGTPLHGTMPA